MVSYHLPPGEKWRSFELHALALRDFAGVTPNEALDPFALARYANLMIVDFDTIAGLSKESRDLLLGPASDAWSGGACSVPLPDGRRVVILNPTHGTMRTNATLMEEVSHVFLGHQPSRLKIVTQDERGKTLARDYRKADEEAAYAIGAAALVPYGALRQALHEGLGSSHIARRFRVSRELVEYRLKVTRLWSMYRQSRLELREPECP